MNKKLFIDLGAHEGDSIDKFYAQVDDAKDYDIYSFEPHPIAFEKLNEHIKLRGYKNVTAVNKAAGTHNIILNLFAARMYEGRGSTLLRNKTTSKIDYENPIDVECIDFCNYLKYQRLCYDYIILKMNVEGSEYDIIRTLLNNHCVGLIDHYCVYFHQNRFADCKHVRFSIIEEAFIREVKRLNIPLRINHHTFGVDDRPEILWVCELPGWAYDKIATELSLKLPKYRHTKIYLNISKGYRSANAMGKAADIVVCFYPPYMEFFDDKSKIILRLDGNRAFECYEKNPKHRKHKTVELESVPVGDEKASPAQVQNNSHS